MNGSPDAMMMLWHGPRAVLAELINDRERIDWLEGVLVGPIPEPPINYDHDTGTWTHVDGRTFTTLREALDVARGRESGGVQPPTAPPKSSSEEIA